MGGPRLRYWAQGWPNMAYFVWPECLKNYGPAWPKYLNKFIFYSLFRNNSLSGPKSLINPDPKSGICVGTRQGLDWPTRIITWAKWTDPCNFWGQPRPSPSCFTPLEMAWYGLSVGEVIRSHFKSHGQRFCNELHRHLPPHTNIEACPKWPYL